MTSRLKRRAPARDHMRGLAARILPHLDGREEAATVIPGLTLFRYLTPQPAARFFFEPCVSLIVQGGKRVSFGDEAHSFGPGQFLLSSIDIPTFVEVSEAPYLSLTFKLDLVLIHEILSVENLPMRPLRAAGRGLSGGTASAELIDVFVRLSALLDKPSDVPVMSGLLHREMLYRLLAGNEGARLRQMSVAGSSAHRLIAVLERIKENYAVPMTIEELARDAGMAVSTFHHRFKALTATSPLQYQESLKLHAARALMLTEGVDAATAAFRVGYESASRFNREYSRFFGLPPSRDITSLQPAEGPLLRLLLR